MLNWLKKSAGKPASPTAAAPHAEPAAPAGAALPTGPAATPDALARADALRGEGNALLAQDDFQGAAGRYEAALAHDPADVAALVNLGFALAELGRLPQAQARLREAARIDPANHDAFFTLGLACERAGEVPAAIEAFTRSTRLQPLFEGGWQNLCRLLAQQGRAADAEAALERAATLYPAAAWPPAFRANLRAAAGRVAEAAAGYREAVARTPGDPELHDVLGAMLEQLGRLDEAAASYTEAVRLAPGLAPAWSHQGNVLRRLGRLAEARASCERSIALDPLNAGAFGTLGTVLIEMREPAAAVAAFDQAIALAPDFADALANRGVALGELYRHAEAVQSFDAALRLKPGQPEAENNRGNTLLAMGRAEDALAGFEAALRRNPRDPLMLNNRGNALRALGRLEEALKSHEAALALKPRFAQAHNNVGVLLTGLGRLPQAVAAFDRALDADPSYAEALVNRGNTLRNQGLLDEALDSYERALALKPGLPFLFGNWLHVRMQACDWRGLEAHFAELARRVAAGEAHNPFTLLATDLGRAAQLQCARSYVRMHHPAQTLPPPAQSRSAHARIRVGYFSADLHEHATAWLMAELFERHDRARFERFVAFSFGPDAPGPMRTRLQNAFDQFHDVRAKSDREVALLARALEIDIAVDLKGYTQNSRPGIFSFRPAPLQVSYLGYPATMGADFIDYLVADAVVVPPSHRDGYSEKIATLPGSYQANDTKRAVSPRAFSRAEAGLPAAGFVFCCFNNNFKIVPELFGLWMRLLRQVDGSVLWLLEGTSQAARHLRAEAAAQGVDPARLVFAGRMPLAEHLARHALADLFLDTTYCNAHTTASDALWTGLPVLTFPGETFASRVAASLVHAVGLPELAVASLADYEATALSLAREPGVLAALKARLAHNRLTQPLFDAARFSGHLEAAYEAMWARHAAGLPPEHFSVAPAAAAVV